MSKKNFSLCLALLLFIGCASWRTEPHAGRQLTNHERQFIQTEFDIQTDRSLLNPDVVALLTGPDGIPIANSQEEYNYSASKKPGLPSRGLIFAGQARYMAFVYYGEGGIVWTPRLLVVELDNNKIIWKCTYYVENYEHLQELKRDFFLGPHKTKDMCDAEQ